MRLSSDAFALGEGPTRGGLSHMRFHAAATNCASSRHSILRLWRGPSPRAYSRGIISHGLSCCCDELCLFEALYPAPLARPFSKGLRAGIISHGLSCRCGELCLFEALQSSPFGAALLQGPTRGGLSHIGFHTAAASCASSSHCNPLPLARPFFKALVRWEEYPNP